MMYTIIMTKRNVNVTGLDEWVLAELDAEAARLTQVRGWKVTRLVLIRGAIIARAERAKRDRLKAERGAKPKGA